MQFMDPGAKWAGPSDGPFKGGTRKIKDAPKPCFDPSHNPPSLMVFEPGTYEHICPSCGNRISIYSSRNLLKMTDEEILEQWKAKICDHAMEIDPDCEFIWHGIWVGFAIGCGMSIDKATDYDFYADRAYPLESL